MTMIGRRVQIHPRFDRWMMGDRYGTIEAITRFGYRVKLDSGHVMRKLDDDDLFTVYRS